MLAPCHAHSDAVNYGHPSHPGAELPPPRPVPLLDTASVHFLDMAPRSSRNRRRSLWQVPDDSDGEDTLFTPAVANAVAVPDTPPSKPASILQVQPH